MKRQHLFSIAIGALIVAGMGWPFSVDAGEGSGWRSAYLGDAGVQVAQQEDAPASTPAPVPAEDKGPGWAVNCKSAAGEAGLECRLSQTVVSQQGRQLLADVTFRIPADKNAPEAILRLPLAIYLPAGATLQVDDRVPLRLNFRACDRNGCYAQAPISTEMLADLQKGRQLKVSFQNLAENPIDVPLSLDGFAEAYAKI